LTRRGEDAVKLFFASNQLVHHNLSKLERQLGLDLGLSSQSAESADADYYPQLQTEIRKQAASMGSHYAVFYSLENTIRQQISDIMSDEADEWWTTQYIPGQIKKDCEARRKKEIESGMTPRSADILAFSNFGELSEIIKMNWSIFSQTFSNVKAVEKVMGTLNSLRLPIAHCSPLAEDEVLRLRLAVRDYFRLME
jgi:Swt1-like HEPN